ncbi:MAG TPA: hypothetical protein VH082_04485 [Rudaea sp.]|nr:hypothetical protein [Rudaea sp.]
MNRARKLAVAPRFGNGAIASERIFSQARSMTGAADVEKLKSGWSVERTRREAATTLAETGIFCAFNVLPRTAVDLANGELDAGIRR